MATNQAKLDLEIVRENFILCQKVKDDIELEYYLKSLEELTRFLGLLGSALGFINSELQSEIAILKNFLSSPDVGQHFCTVKTMIEYERRKHLLNKEEYISGSRALLRLHRGLEFILACLKGLIKLGEREEASTVCHDAYMTTLANHHSNLIIAATKLATCNLPVKHELLAKVCGREENIRRAEEIMPETLELGLEIYNIIQNIYKKKKLLSLS
ncbi:hypothetical protein WA026_008297 [Henosepilachna vigintioctopunctata]|uniref:Glycolipid transfer protein domain-containing protein n=1 Tax=Henosepilachna vigintioctopunctata TaxID=420089 RepID=A0AAW1TQW1_9CUCU